MPARTLHKVVTGFQIVWTVQLVDGNGSPLVNTFDGSETLVAEVWAGDSTAVLFNPSAVWLSGPLGTVNITYSVANTTVPTVLPPGYYEGLLFLSGTTTAAAIWDLSLAAAPGTATFDLVSLPRVRAQLADLPLTYNMLEFLPTAVMTAQEAVRTWCNRHFNRRTITREFCPSYDGRVRLDERPVMSCRVRGSYTQAMTITASSTACQIAYAGFSSTGNRDDYTYLVTGLNLVSTASGVTTTTNLLFATYITLSSLVTAINALGSPWHASLDSQLSAWPTTELYGGDTQQGAIQDGVILYVYDADTSDYRLDWETGMVWCGQSTRSSLDSPRWGPGYQQFSHTQPISSKVLVTYDAGYDTIPQPIQQATAELVKLSIQRFTLDETLRSETAEDYSWTRDNMIGLMTDAIRQSLSGYRLPFA